MLENGNISRVLKKSNILFSEEDPRPVISEKHLACSELETNKYTVPASRSGIVEQCEKRSHLSPPPGELAARNGNTSGTFKTVDCWSLFLYIGLCLALLPTGGAYFYSRTPQKVLFLCSLPPSRGFAICGGFGFRL